MIEITNLSKFYKDYKALYLIDLNLPRYGMIAIQGPSGCGKTTLLNCIAGLIPYEGQIKIDGFDYKNKSENQKSYFRLSNIGFIFQDFRLFENETVIDNVLFPLETLNNSERGRKLIKCDELLKLVDLRWKAKQFVSSLSGGEKQRVCIARSLINDPKIILADEPTGALDEKNTMQIMDILSNLSNKSLVIFVTHDDTLANKYGDQIIKMEDGEIKEIIYQSKESKKAYIPIVKTRDKNKKPSIPLTFVFRHSLHSLFKKKVRSIICSITTSIGLIGVGLALSISSFISNNVKEAYSSLIKKDQIIVSLKDTDKTKYGEFKASLYETEKIARKNKESVIDIGVNYVADFESIFCDANELNIADTIYKTPIRGITARNINEFEWLDISNKDFYPEKVPSLKDDEIYLGLPITSVNDLCYLLRIERSVSSLSDYLLNNDCYLVFNFEHAEWEYLDQQIVNLKGFTLENDLKIYHTNHLWNQYMFEEMMRFPTDEGVDEEDYYPWTFKKYYYLYCNENIDSFLTYINKTNEYNDFVLEIADKKHFPLLYKSVDVKDKRRVIVFNNKLSCLDSDLADVLMDYDDNLCDPTIGCSEGYVIYPNNLMMGFSQNTFLSFDFDKVNDAIDVETNYKLNEEESIEYPHGILLGHFTKSMLKGLSFNTVPEKLTYGRKPENLDEIVISSGIANLIEEDYLNRQIYFSFPSSIIQSSTGELLKTYKTIPLTVVGLVYSGEDIIYHNSMWPISFFQSRIGLSMFSLKPQNISFSLKDSNQINASLDKLKRGFPEYDIINPLKDIDNSVDELSNYVSIVSFLFSLLASITSILLLSICSYLHVYETRHEIGLARCIGANKRQASKFIYSHALTLAGISLVLSCIELFIVSCIISLEMNGKFLLIISPLPYFAMFGLALAISLFASLFIHLSIQRHNPIEATKY